MDVGRLGAAAGGLRSFWPNGPSVFCIFEKAWKQEEEARRGRKEASARSGRRSPPLQEECKLPELSNGPRGLLVFEGSV